MRKIADRNKGAETKSGQMPETPPAWCDIRLLTRAYDIAAIHVQLGGFCDRDCAACRRNPGAQAWIIRGASRSSPVGDDHLGELLLLPARRRHAKREAA